MLDEISSFQTDTEGVATEEETLGASGVDADGDVVDEVEAAKPSDV